MPLNRDWYNTLVNDDGSDTVGSVWDKTDVGAIFDEVDKTLCICETVRGSGFTVPLYTETVVTWDATELQSHGTMHTAGDSRVYAPFPGIYLVTCTLIWSPDTAGGHGVRIRINGGIATAYNWVPAMNIGSQGMSQFFHFAYTLGAGHYVETMVQTNGTITQTLLGGSRMIVQRLT